MIILILYISTHISTTIALNNEDINNEETIVFDNSTGFFGMENEGPLGLSTLRDELEFKGYNVNDNIEMRLSADTITKDLINEAHILILINSDRRFEREEIALIKDFVVKGGKLLLIADTPESLTNINRISRRFGAEFLGYYLGDEVSSVSLCSNQSNILKAKLRFFPFLMFLFKRMSLSPRNATLPSPYLIPAKTIKFAFFTFFPGLSHTLGHSFASIKSV